MLNKKLYLFSHLQPCWKCKKEIRVYYIFPSEDDFKENQIPEILDRINPEGYPEISDWLINNVKTIEKRLVKSRNSEFAVNVCEYCDSLQGNSFIVHDKLMQKKHSKDLSVRIEKKIDINEIQAKK